MEGSPAVEDGSSLVEGSNPVEGSPPLQSSPPVEEGSPPEDEGSPLVDEGSLPVEGSSEVGDYLPVEGPPVQGSTIEGSQMEWSRVQISSAEWSPVEYSPMEYSRGVEGSPPVEGSTGTVMSITIVDHEGNQRKRRISSDIGFQNTLTSLHVSWLVDKDSYEIADFGSLKHGETYTFPTLQLCELRWYSRIIGFNTLTSWT